MGVWTALILASQLLLHVDGQALGEFRCMMCGRFFFLVFFLALLCINYLKRHYIFTCHND